MATDLPGLLPDPDRPSALRALHTAGLLDDPRPLEALDRIVRLAVRTLGAPIAAVTLVSEDRQVVRSAVGLPDGLRTLPGEAAHLLRELGAAALAGVPLRLAGGQVVGALFVVDTRPRDWTPAEREILDGLGAAASGELEWRCRTAELEAADAIIRLQGAHLEQLFEAAPEGVVLLDPEHRVVRANGEFLRVFGYRGEEVVGRPIDELIVPDELREEALALSRTGRAGQPVNVETVRRRRDGGLLHVSILGKPVHLDDSPVAAYVTYRDITGRKRAEEEREAAVAARDRFYANVSHELRTPISAVMLYNDLLLSGAFGPVTPEQAEGIGRSQKSAGHLLELVNEVLDLAKLEAGKMVLRTEEVALGELLRGTLGAVRPLALEYGCEISLEQEEAPAVVRTDPRRLRQILLNLLSNAVKFGRAHPVRLVCRASSAGVVIEVTDQGPGIAEGDIPRIFEEFVQLGDLPGEGTGLGLPISRQLARLMGGRLEVDSTPGVGSTFRLVLPEAPPAPLPT